MISAGKFEAVPNVSTVPLVPTVTTTATTAIKTIKTRATTTTTTASLHVNRKTHGKTRSGTRTEKNEFSFQYSRA